MTDLYAIIIIVYTNIKLSKKKRFFSFNLFIQVFVMHTDNQSDKMIPASPSSRKSYIYIRAAGLPTKLNLYTLHIAFYIDKKPHSPYIPIYVWWVLMLVIYLDRGNSERNEIVMMMSDLVDSLFECTTRSHIRWHLHCRADRTTQRHEVFHCLDVICAHTWMKGAIYHILLRIYRDLYNHK